MLSPLPATVVIIPLVSHLADDVVTRIRNEQVAGGVHRHASRDHSIPHWSPRPRRRSNLIPVARHCGDNPVGAHLADAVVTGIRNEQVAGGVHRHAEG